MIKVSTKLLEALKADDLSNLKIMSIGLFTGRMPDHADSDEAGLELVTVYPTRVNHNGFEGYIEETGIAGWGRAYVEDIATNRLSSFDFDVGDHLSSSMLKMMSTSVVKDGLMTINMPCDFLDNLKKELKK